MDIVIILEYLWRVVSILIILNIRRIMNFLEKISKNKDTTLSNTVEQGADNILDNGPVTINVIHMKSENVYKYKKRQRKPMKKYPKEPRLYHPALLINQLWPGLEPEYTMVSLTPSIFRVQCVIDGVHFVGQESSKKKAFTELAIAAMSYLYGYEYRR